MNQTEKLKREKTKFKKQISSLSQEMIIESVRSVRKTRETMVGGFVEKERFESGVEARRSDTQ